MKSRQHSRNRSNADKGDGEEAAVNQLSKEVAVGDLIWVKIHGSSWWPAQVVDDNTVSQNIKPSDRSASDVLVRLYGSYKHMYVDPRTCQLEFENILKQHNGNQSEILSETLEQDIGGLKSRRGKRKESQFEGKVRVGSPRGKKVKQDITKTVLSSSRNHPDVDGVETGMLKADSDARTSVDNASGDVETGEHSTKKNLIESGTTSQRTSRSQTRISQRTLAVAANTSDAKVKSGNSLSEKAGKAKSTKLKPGEKQNSVGPHSPNSTRIYPRTTTAGGSKPKMNNGDSTSAKTNFRESKRQRGEQSKSQNQNLVQKRVELEPNSPSSTMISPRRTTAGGSQPKMKNGDSTSAKTNDMKSKRQSGVQSKSEDQNLVQKKVELEPNSPSSEKTPAGKSQELTARRIKVMQCLGLIAPSGSPFH